VDECNALRHSSSQALTHGVVVCQHVEILKLKWRSCVEKKFSLKQATHSWSQNYATPRWDGAFNLRFIIIQTETKWMLHTARSFLDQVSLWNIRSVRQVVFIAGMAAHYTRRCLLTCETKWLNRSALGVLYLSQVNCVSNPLYCSCHRNRGLAEFPTLHISSHSINVLMSLKQLFGVFFWGGEFISALLHT